MIRSAQFQHDRQLIDFMHAEGISPAAVYSWRTTTAGFIAIFYDDGTANPYVDGKPSWAGVSYGEDTNIPTPAGSVIEVTSKRTQVTNENKGAGTATFSATLTSTYVLPKSVTITDSGASAPTLVDDGLGRLVLQSNGQVRGTIDYSTGDIDIIWHPADETPTGSVLATYQHSDLPGTSTVPPRVELNTLLITCVAGGAVTTVDWAIYEDSAAANPPIASGTTPITAGDTVAIDLGDVLSMNLDLVDTNSRWVKLTPDDAVNEFQVQLRWKNPSWKPTLG